MQSGKGTNVRLKQAGWTIGFITEDQRPVAEYSCPHCHTDTYFELTGNGKVPDPKCCIRCEPFPLQHYDHLRKKPEWTARPMSAVTDVSHGILRDKVVAHAGKLFVRIGD